FALDSLGSGRAGFALDSLRSGRAGFALDSLGSGRAGCALGSLGSFRAGGALGSLGSCRAGGALRSLRSGRAGGALGAVGARCARCTRSSRRAAAAFEAGVQVDVGERCFAVEPNGAFTVQGFGRAFRYLHEDWKDSLGFHTTDGDRYIRGQFFEWGTEAGWVFPRYGGF